MDTQIWEKLLLLFIGGVMTALGAWFNELRSERRRKNAKLEEAYLAWLNSQASVLARLKELTKSVEREPESIEAHALLMEKFERLHSDLQNLSFALNLAFIYERDREKKALVEGQALLYTKLTEGVGVVIRHHKAHLDFHKTIDEANSLVETGNALVARTGELINSNTDDSKTELSKLTELKQWAERNREEARKNRDKASNHLLTCSANLSEDAKGFSKDVEEIEKQSPALRRALVE